MTVAVSHLEHPTVLLEAVEGAVVAVKHWKVETLGALYIIKEGATEQCQGLPAV